MYHKMKKLASFIFGICILGVASSCSESQFNITGKVTCEGKPVKGVVISDGVEVVTTDRRGRYYMESAKENDYVFISIPAGYDVEADGLIPRHFTRIKRNAVDTADFDLVRCDNDNHTMVFSTDIHLTGDDVDKDLPQFHSTYLPSITKFINELDGKVYSSILGDMSTDGKWYSNSFALPEYLEQMAVSYPTPIYHVMGNHDNERRGEGTIEQWDEIGESAYKRIVGPNYYSVNIGQIHYVYLDNIVTFGKKPKGYGSEDFDWYPKYGFRYIVDSTQVEWLKKDLSHVDSKTPVIVSMHVPLYDIKGMEDGKVIYKVGSSKFQNPEVITNILDRFENVHLVAGHVHHNCTINMKENLTLHNLVSASAVSWKLNDVDRVLICEDGSPAGYLAMTVKGKDISWQFKANGESIEKSQFRFYDLNEVDPEYGGLPGENMILINVFTWDDKWDVRAWEDGKELKLEQYCGNDPLYTKIRNTTKMLLHRPTAFRPNTPIHLFRAKTSSATSTITVVVTDRFGNRYQDVYRQSEPVSSSVIFSKGDNGYDTFRIPALLKTAGGSILAFAEARRYSKSDTGDIDLVLRRSDDGGKTWGDMEMVWDDAENVCGNPAPILDRESGKIVLVTTWNKGTDHESDIHARTSEDTRKVFVMFSEDDGRTWSAAHEITSQTKDPEWTWYATGPCHGLQISKGQYKGRMVVPCNHGVFEDGRATGTVSHIIYSDDIGQTWKIGAIAKTGNESTVAELEDGTLMLNMRVWNNKSVKRTDFDRDVAWSTDGGETFCRESVESGLIEPRCNASIINWYRNGEPTSTLLFSNPDHRSKRVDMTLKQSNDNGQSWTPTYRLDGKKAAYSDLMVFDDGDVGILYECGDKGPYEKIVFTRLPSKIVETNRLQ